MITFINKCKKTFLFSSALLISTVYSAFGYNEGGNQALIVEKHAEFVLKNKSKIESHLELMIKMLESEKYKPLILSFNKNEPIEDFVIYQALVQLGHEPFDIILDAHKALSLPASTKVSGIELYKYFVIPYDPAYIGALTTGYQLPPSAVEKATEAAEFLIPIYEILLEALLEFDEFDQPDAFRYSNHNYGHGDGLSEKFRILGSSDARINKKIRLNAFLPILSGGYGAYDSVSFPRDSSLKDLNLSQLRLLEKIYEFKSAYPYYFSPAPYRDVGDKYLLAIQESIEKLVSEPDFSDLGSSEGTSDEGTGESSALNFEDLEL